MPQLSIIVPIYNVEKYLPKCLDSILAQTFRNFELLLIDDGSPDQCGRICDEYAGRDTRIHVIHKPNGGVSSARNAGLDIATGEYIGFVDPDDWIEPNMYEKLLATVCETGAKIAACGFVRYDKEYHCLQKQDDSLECQMIQYKGEELLRVNFALPPPIGGSVCGKIFHINLLQNLRFDESLTVGEDVLFLLQACMRANLLAQISDMLYCVYCRPGSATRSDSQWCLRRLKADRKCLDIVSNCSPEVLSNGFYKFFDTVLKCLNTFPEKHSELARVVKQELKKADYLSLKEKLRYRLILLRYWFR